MKRTLLLLAALAATAGMPSAAAATLAKATFAGGCFWCMEPPFERLAGVVSVTSGYAGGHADHPTYDDVSGGGTGHRESVEVLYDPRRISYATLLDIFWHNVDPTDSEGQFCDRGNQYRTAVFFHDETQHRLAEQSRLAVTRRLGSIATDILPAGPFFRAEEEHQDYYRKNPWRYRLYRYNCGRDKQLKKLWGQAPSH